MSVWLIKCRKVIFFFLILENSGTIHGWRFWLAVSQRVMYIVCFKEMFVCVCCFFLWRLWNYFYRQRQNMCLKCELFIFNLICFTVVKRLRSRHCTEYEKTAILWQSYMYVVIVSETAVWRAFIRQEQQSWFESTFLLYGAQVILLWDNNHITST